MEEGDHPHEQPLSKDPPVEEIAVDPHEELADDPPLQPPSSGFQVEQDQYQYSQEQIADQMERMKVNSSVMNQAVAERKRDNILALRLYEEQHRTYYYNHTNILTWVQTQLDNNVHKARDLYREVYEYFGHLKEGYNQLARGMGNPGAVGNLTADPNFGTNWGANLKKGLIGLLQVKSELSLEAERFSSWIEDSLLVKLNQAISAFESPISSFHTSIDGKRKIVDQCLQNFMSKFNALNKFVSTREGAGKTDMMYEELLLVDISKQVKERVVDWGKTLSQYWHNLQHNESILIHSIQKNVELFLIEYSKIHQKSKRLGETEQLWEKMKTEEESLQNYSIDRLLAEDQKVLIRQTISKDTLKNIDFERFAQLQRYDEIFGSLTFIAQSLHLKKFHCRIDNNNSDIVVYSSVDGYLLFVIQVNKKPLNKMALKDLTIQRLGTTTVEVGEKQKGFFTSKWNKETLHFVTADEAEEFLFCIVGVFENE